MSLRVVAHGDEQQAGQAVALVRDGFDNQMYAIFWYNLEYLFKWLYC